MRIIAPFGFYGWGNIGDEATLQGFARLVADAGARLRVAVASRNPSHTARVEPSFRYFPADGSNWKRWWAEKRSSAMVVAGGTPIMDCLGDWPLCAVTPLVEEAYSRGLPIAFVGIGAETLERDLSRRIVGQRLGPCIDRWTVRSTKDQSRLIDYGVPADRVTVAADMAWLLDPVGPDWGRRRLQEWGLGDQARLVGVNLLGEKAVLARQPQLFEKIAALLDVLVEQFGVHVLFLANEVRKDDTFDTAAAHKTKALMKQGSKTFVAPSDYLAPQQMLSLIANCEATVSMRYHFCLFSALQAVPFIALERSDKVADLCTDLDWQFRAVLSDLHVARLVDSYAAMHEQRAHASEELRKRVSTFRMRAMANQTGLEALHDRAHADVALSSFERAFN
jgi:polysaccharide pyruvyl transferase WcaK-like protein